VSVYDRWILPRLTHFVMRSKMLANYRARALRAATSDVLEIGMGSGLNFPCYGEEVRRIIGVEPSAPLVRMAEEGAQQISVPVNFLVMSTEELPLPEGHTCGRRHAGSVPLARRKTADAAHAFGADLSGTQDQ